jgi:hypothetical protein
MKSQIIKSQIIKSLEAQKRTSAWNKGVTGYALDLVNECEGDLTEGSLLNGASDWSQYSSGGYSLIYDTDIAEALCTPSELKRNDNGRLPPNAYECWLDVQSRALAQAFDLIRRAVRSASA